VAGSSVVLTMQGGLMWQAFGLYVPFWQSVEGWSAAALAVAFSVYQATSVLLSPLQALLLSAIGPRRAIQIGVVIAGGGMAVVSTLDTLPAFFAAMVVIGLGFSLCGGMSFSTIMINWFERRRARALALMQVGKGVGGLMVLAVAASLATYGWRVTILASGLLFLVVGLAVAFAMRDTPESCGLRPDGDPPAEEGEGAGALPGGGPVDRGMGMAVAMRTSAFWQINVASGLLAMVVTALVAHMAVHLQQVGFSLTFAATMVALVTMAATVGLMVAGVVGDRVGKRSVSAAAASGHGVALVLLALSQAPWVVVASVALHGFCWGLRDPLMQALRVDYFGRALFVGLEGIVRVFVGIGMVLGPVVVALMRDRGGDYVVSFLFLAAAGVAGATLLALARPPRRSPPLRRVR
jgi:sugar phosphate permease